MNDDAFVDDEALRPFVSFHLRKSCSISAERPSLTVTIVKSSISKTSSSYVSPLDDAEADVIYGHL